MPKWKKELSKAKSFDAALTELGINGAFLNAKEIGQELKSPTKVDSKPCTAE